MTKQRVLTEDEAIEIIMSVLGELEHREAILKWPDDAHDIPVDAPRIVVSTDGNTEKFSRYPWEEPYDWSWRALTGPVADIVAKGARPLGFTIDLGLPRDVDKVYLKSLAKGLRDSAIQYGLSFLGGDTNTSGGEYGWISVSVIGVAGNKLVPRGGGSPGEPLFTTLVNGYGLPGLIRLLFYKLGKQTLELLGSNVKWRPKVVLDAAYMLREAHATSSIDTSDGMLRSLIMLSRSSGTGICLNNLPEPDPFVAKMLEDLRQGGGKSLWEKAVLEGGEEYEIIFSSKLDPEHVYSICSNKGIRCMMIGEYCGEPAGTVRYRNVRYRDGGWDNLAKTL